MKGTAPTKQRWRREIKEERKKKRKINQHIKHTHERTSFTLYNFFFDSDDCVWHSLNIFLNQRRRRILACRIRATSISSSKRLLILRITTCVYKLFISINLLNSFQFDFISLKEVIFFFLNFFLFAVATSEIFLFLMNKYFF